MKSNLLTFLPLAFLSACNAGVLERGHGGGKDDDHTHEKFLLRARGGHVDGKYAVQGFNETFGGQVLHFSKSKKGATAFTFTEAGLLLTPGYVANQDKLAIGGIEVFYMDTPAAIIANDYQEATCTISKRDVLTCDVLGSKVFQVSDGFLFLGFKYEGPPYHLVTIEVDKIHH